MRRTGFERPFSKPQVVAWVLKVCLGGIFLGLVVPVLPAEVSYILWGVCGAGLCFALVLMVVLTAWNPGHPDLSMVKPWEEPEPEEDYSRPAIDPATGYCRICRVVAHRNTKHCWTCSKCIAGFDHHCMWLNNCVGETNYSLFFLYLITMTLVALSLSLISAVVFVAYLIQPDSFQERAEATFGSSYPHFLTLVFSGMCALLGGIASALLIHLAGFHVYLIYRGESTYAYILRKRDEDEPPSYSGTSDLEHSSVSGSHNPDSSFRHANHHLDLGIPRLLQTQSQPATGSPLSSRNRPSRSNRVAPLSLVTGSPAIAHALSPREMAAVRVADFAASFARRDHPPSSSSTPQQSAGRTSNPAFDEAPLSLLPPANPPTTSSALTESDTLPTELTSHDHDHDLRSSLPVYL